MKTAPTQNGIAQMDTGSFTDAWVSAKKMKRRKTMTDEYIRKQDAVDLVNKISNLDLKAKGGICVSLVNLEKADVVPVVHGKWMKEDRGHVEYCAVCDQCGFDLMWSDRGYFKFCPNCGAKMDVR